LAGINSWKFSFVGDEWAFYGFAQEIANNNLLINPFGINGVYGENRILGSWYQAVFIKIFGDSNFAWRLSNIVLIFPLSFFFYRFTRIYFSKKIAFFSLILMQFSFYLLNFFKIGYLNSQALVLLVLCCYLSAVAGKKATFKNIVLLGLSLGVSFYVYIGPLFPLLIWPFLLPLFDFKNNRRQKTLKAFGLLALIYLLSITPAIIELSSWGGAIKKTVLAKEFSDNTQILLNIFHNFLLFYKNYDYFYNHFIAGPYLDVVTRILALIGTGNIILKIKIKKYFYLLLSYISTCIVFGATSPYSYSPATRGIFFLPFGFLFAGIGLNFLLKFLKPKKMALLFIFVLITVINIYQSQIGVFKKVGYTATSLILKEILENRKTYSEGVTLLLISEDHHYKNYGSIFQMLPAYGLKRNQFLVNDLQNINCNDIENKKVIYFNDDLPFQELIGNCHPDTMKELSPSMWL
jgi:4-amino-4-deoxy-L-arabinose transferase-like glycosyltransferase